MFCANRALRIESLEQKQMLAGDVLVNVVNGVLTLEGDDLGNQVVVSSGEEPNTFVIRGLDGTQIIEGDAEPGTEIIVEGVRHGLRANLGGGDDVLRVEDAVFRGNVAINTGAGNDRVVIGALPVEMEALLAVDDETTDTASVRLGRNLLIHTGEGDDTVVIADTVGRGSLVVETGRGDDTVRLGRADETEPTDDETAAVSSVESEADFAADVSFALGVHVGLGAGDDTLHVHNLRAGGLHANGGAGADTMRIEDVRSHAIILWGGLGDEADIVSVGDVVTRLLFAHLGGGDDTLTLKGVKAQLALLHGGAGEADTLTLLGENMIRHRRVAGFEIRNPSE